MADVQIRVLANTATAQRALGRTSRSVRGLGTATRRTAAPVRSMRTNLAGLSQTAGIAQSSIFQLSGAFILAGGLVLGLRAATKSSIGFQTEMTKIQTLVGVQPELVEQWSESLREMAPAVGVGPRELSKALFVVTSAGIRTAEALNIVELAAKASAIGLGDVASIARAVTSAMQAYAKTNLTAAEATDILVATVREGNLAADELASSLGRVLGIAAEVGVGFAELGGFVAAFTRVGVSAEEAVTALRGILNTTLKPTKQARDALAEFGITIADVRRAIKEDGLARTLIDLVSILRENEDALAAVFGNVRALSGVLATAGAQAAEFDKIVRNVADATGIVEEGFLTVGATAQQSLNEMKAAIEVVAATIGDKMLPALANFASGWAAIIAPVDSVAQSQIAFLSASTSVAMLTERLNQLGAERVKNEEKLKALGPLENLFRGNIASETIAALRSQNIAFEFGNRLVLQRSEAERAAAALRPGARANIFAPGPPLLSAAQTAEIATSAAAVLARLAKDVELEFALHFVPTIDPIVIKPPKLDFAEILFGEDSVAEMLARASAAVEAARTPAENLQRAIDSLSFAEMRGAITTDEMRIAQEFLRASFQESTASFLEMAAQIAPSIANVIAQVIRSIRGEGGGGFFGAVSGILGGAASVASFVNPVVAAGLLSGSIIAGALRSRRETPVKVESFGPRAIQQQEKIQRGPDTVILQIISPTTGEILDEILYTINRNERTDNFQRIPRFVGSGPVNVGAGRTVRG